MFYKLMLSSILVIGFVKSAPTPGSMNHSGTASWSETNGIREHLSKGAENEPQSNRAHTSGTNDLATNSTKKVSPSNSSDNPVTITSHNKTQSGNVIIDGDTAIIQNDEGENLAGTDSASGEGAQIVETRTTKKANKELDFTSKQKQNIKQIIDEHIRNNPKIIEEAIDKLEQKREKEEFEKIKEQNKKQQLKVNANREVLLDESTASIYGNKNGYKIMVVFYDDNCQYCRDFGRLIPDFVNADSELKVIMRPWPILGNQSREVAAVLLAASKQNRFDILYQEIVQHSTGLDKLSALELARKAKLDMQKLKNDIDDSNQFKSILNKNAQLALEIGLVGTPTILLGNKKQLNLIELGYFSPDSFKKSIQKIEQGVVAPDSASAAAG